MAPPAPSGEDPTGGHTERRGGTDSCASAERDNDENGDETTSAGTTSIPLPSLFAAPRRSQVQISPRGTYLAWTGRDPTCGVSNLFVRRRRGRRRDDVGDGDVDDGVENDRQVTFERDRDACALFRFTPDDETILYLRETSRGSEAYHLHAVDVAPFFDDEDGEGGSAGDDAATKYIGDPSSPPPPPRLARGRPREVIADPGVTCALGFVGGVQLWTDPFSPRTAYVSTARRGPLAMFWDVSRVDVDTSERSIVELNPLSTWAGRIRFAVQTLACWAVRWASRGAVSWKLPTAPLQWFPDGGFRFRGRLDFDLDMGASFLVRGGGRGGVGVSGKWRTIHHVPFEDTNLQLVGSSGGAGTARMQFKNGGGDSCEDTVDVHLCAVVESSSGGGAVSDTTTYERYDVSTGRRLRRLARNDGSDICGFVAHPRTGRAQAVSYERERLSTEVLEDAGEGDDGREKRERTKFTCDLRFLEEMFEPSSSFRIVSRTVDDDLWIVCSESDAGQRSCGGSPGGYFLFDRTIGSRDENFVDNDEGEKRKRIRLIFPTRPELSKFRLAKMEPVRIAARDGEDLLCYLSSPPSLPPLSDPASTSSPPPPMVVIVHGGPQARDTWGYRPLCQLLCDRGMRVLQVNYRGSTGFGSRFLRLGLDGQFCEGVQHDVVDATRWAIERGYADSRRLAIVGASFGGYSALWSMAFQPGLYKCAAAICPITAVGAANDCPTAFGGSPVVARYWRRVFGEKVWNDRKAAEDASPLYGLDGVRDPVMLMHGENDVRAPIEHSDQAFEVLRRRRTNEGGSGGNGDSGERGSVYITFADEGHGIQSESNRMYMHSALEQFLSENLELTDPPLLDEKWIRGHTAKIRGGMEDYGRADAGMKRSAREKKKQ